MIFWQETLVPKRNYENPDLNLGSQGCHHEKSNELQTLDLNSGPIASELIDVYFAIGQ